MSIPSLPLRSPLAAIVPWLWAALTFCLSGCHAQLKTSPETAALTDLRRAIAHHEKHEEVVEAIELQEELTSRLLKEPGENSRVTIEALAHLAKLYSRFGDSDRALGLYLRASRLADKTMGKQDRLSIWLLYRTVMTSDNGNNILRNEKLQEIWNRRPLGAPPLERAFIKMTMAEVYAAGRDYEYALKNYQESTSILIHNKLKHHHMHVRILYEMADCYLKLGRSADALRLENDALRESESGHRLQISARNTSASYSSYIAKREYELVSRENEGFLRFLEEIDPIEHRSRVDWAKFGFLKKHGQTMQAIKELKLMEKQMVDEVGSLSTKLYPVYDQLSELYDWQLDIANADKYSKRKAEILANHHLLRISNGGHVERMNREHHVETIESSKNTKNHDIDINKKNENYKVMADKIIADFGICFDQMARVVRDLEDGKESYRPDRQCMIRLTGDIGAYDLLSVTQSDKRIRDKMRNTAYVERLANHMFRLFSPLGNSRAPIALSIKFMDYDYRIPNSIILPYYDDMMKNSRFDNVPLLSKAASLARLLLGMGDLQRAEQLYQRINDSDIRRDPVGNLHDALWQYAKILAGKQNLDEVYGILGRLFKQTEGMTTSGVSLVTQDLPPWSHRHDNMNTERIYVMTAAYPDHPGIRRLAVRAALLWKGRTIEGMAIYSQAFSVALQKEDQERVRLLRDLHSRLSTLSWELARELPNSNKHDALIQLQTVRLQIEAREGELAKSPKVAAWLSQQLAGLSDTGACQGQDRAGETAPVQCQDLSARMLSGLTRALPSHTAYVEYVQYRDPEEEEAQYLALIVKGTGELAAVPLGPAAVIDAQVQELLRHTNAGDEGYRRPTQLLYDLTWRKLQYLLDDAQRVYVSPDGQLALLPFHMLHDGRRYLDEQLEIVNLTSGRDLLRRHEDAPATGVTVMFAPAYSLAKDAPQVLLSSAAHRGVRLRRGYVFDPVPGTEREAKAIAAQWKDTQQYSGADASESTLFRLTPQGILHIAAHGVFDDRLAGTDDGGRSAKRTLERQQGEKTPQPEVEIPPQGPLLKSALVLAGANVRKHSEILPGQLPPSDGLATALEIASSSHVGTQLVILSACETAKGAVQTGEGVLGLRTAWLATGVESLVASHWKVDDEVTAEFMAYYHRLLAQGLGRAAGLRQAAAEIRRKYPHPHYWAAFSLFGEAGPLRGMGDKAILGPKLDAAPVR